MLWITNKFGEALSAKAWILSSSNSTYIDYLMSKFPLSFEFSQPSQMFEAHRVSPNFLFFSFLRKVFLTPTTDFFSWLYPRDLERFAAPPSLSLFSREKGRTLSRIHGARRLFMNSFGSPFNRITSGVWNLISRWKIAWARAWNKHGPRFRVTAFVTAHFYRDAHGRNLSFCLRRNFDIYLWGPTRHIYFREKRYNWLSPRWGKVSSIGTIAAVTLHHATNGAFIKIPRSNIKLLTICLIDWWARDPKTSRKNRVAKFIPLFTLITARYKLCHDIARLLCSLFDTYFTRFA